MRFSLLPAVLALAVSTAPALAEPVTYICNLTKGGKAGTWISPQVVILHDAANGVVAVNDAVILSFGGKPVAGTVKVDNDKRITFGWTVEEVTARGGRKASMRYVGTLIKGSNVFRLSAFPMGYDNSFRGGGNCVVQAG